ncbi:MAG: penicillin-binding protein 2 [Pontimonas sp.]|nr:penicillin-binding protein 2 [Pontimonas sp.]MCF8547453.1 penicillin-binding protein 2 [Pontimonas sp.]
MSGRRVAFALATVMVVSLVFVGRLVDVQIVRAAELQEQSLQVRTTSETLWASRGSIVDQFGNDLALDVDRYDISANPSKVSDFRRAGVVVPLAQAVAEIAQVTGANYDQMLSAISADPTVQFTYLVKGVTPEAKDALRELDIPWLQIDLIRERIYPFGPVTANLTGMLGRDEPLGGVELAEDDCLMAQNGFATYQQGADGVRLPGTTTLVEQPIHGGTAHLTIDSDLQWYVLQQLAEHGGRLQAQQASAIVVRVSDGHILAAADWPTFDPNDFSDAPPEHMGARTFSAPYEPGSIMKSMGVAMLIDAGHTSVSDRIVAPGFYNIGSGRFIKNMLVSDARQLTTAGVLQTSSNTGMAVLGERMPQQQAYDYFRAFGFGEKTAVDFLGESRGVLRTPEDHDPFTRFAQLYGQGISVTAAQMAGAYQALANDGVRLPLRLYDGCTTSLGEFIEAPVAEPIQVVSASAARQTVNILEAVVTQSALRPVLEIPGYRVAAKTGTAEIATASGYGSERVISLAGMAPAEDPEYVVLVSFYKPQSSKVSSAAAPAFTDLMSHVLKHYRVAPSSEPAVVPPLTW